MKLSIIILAKNEEKKIKEALATAKTIGDEILVLDGGSTDKTVEIAKRFHARIVRQKGEGYADWRNQGLKIARGDWVLYLDADERITKNLADEIKKTVFNDQANHVAYAIPRRNIIFDLEMKHGGWWPDYVKRLFKKRYLKKWKGRLHEEPVFEGSLGHLRNPLLHQKHLEISEMVDKTNIWSVIEAELLFSAKHPKMSWWRFLRIMLSELWMRLITKHAFLDGPKGVIYAFYQMWSRFITYSKLWEMQVRHNLRR